MSSYSIPSQEIGLGNVSEMTYFVSNGTQNHNSINNVLSLRLTRDLFAIASRTIQAPISETAELVVSSVLCVILCRRRIHISLAPMAAKRYASADGHFGSFR